MMNKILVVDDDDSTRKIFRQTLEPLNYEVIEASSGKHVLQLILENQFSVIFLDILMDEQEGLETIRQIRERSQIPVIMMSCDEEYLAISKELGANHLMNKPLDLNEVIRQCNKYTSA